jgi:hypothetical protein
MWQDGRGDRRVLRLKVMDGFLRLLPPVQVIVKPELEPEVNAVLERYLGEWPDERDA